MKMTDLNLAALKYFIDSVELGSISRAAEKNGISRPAVSQAILRLEEWAGRTLLKHQKRTFELTAEGKAFFRTAKASFEALQNSFDAENNAPGSIRIGCSATLGEFVLTPALKHLTNKRAAAAMGTIRVKLGTSAQVRQLLSDREINMGLVIDDGRNAGFRSYVFHEGRFRLASLSGRPEGALITTEPRFEVEALEKYIRRRDWSFSSRIRAESWSTCARMATAQLGVCLIPDLLATLPLKVITTTGFNPKYRALILIRDANTLTAEEDELLNLLRRGFGGLQSIV